MLWSIKLATNSAGHSLLRFFVFSEIFLMRNREGPSEEDPGHVRRIQSIFACENHSKIAQSCIDDFLVHLVASELFAVSLVSGILSDSTSIII